MIDRSRRRFLAGLSAGALAGMLPGAASALGAVTGFRQGVAEAAAGDEVLAAFYRDRGFEGIWAGSAEAGRRNALLAAMAEAPAHGLGRSRHDPLALVRTLQGALTPYDQGRAEVEMSRTLLRLARDLGAGMLRPSDADRHIKREVRAADPLALLTVFPLEETVGFLRGLAPASPEYARLLRERMVLEALIAGGGWGAPAPASEGRVEPGASGAPVVALRDRLIAMGHLQPTATASYDDRVRAAVERFQAAHGLEVDGVAGEGTLQEMNVSPEERLRSVLVALERERWNGGPRGARHVWVNLADFTAAVVDDDVTTFRTRSVIGAEGEDRQSPEFSDLMEYMVINPSWHVPRSIIMNEYLPALRRNRNAAGHLRIINSSGQVVSRGNVSTGGSFPYSMVQPPGPGNALGIVKFMFPNPWNIYLHDTPSKDLFARETRAFSHGCIRLADPVGFAHHLLARQVADPVAEFDDHLRPGAESRVDLDQPVPVHLDYRTAFTRVEGGLEFRRDVYGRDGRIWAALEAEGVETVASQG